MKIKSLIAICFLLLTANLMADSQEATGQAATKSLISHAQSVVCPEHVNQVFPGTNGVKSKSGTTMAPSARHLEPPNAHPSFLSQ